MWSNFYEAGGWGMHPTSLFGFLLLAASALHALRPAEKLRRLVLALGVTTVAAGLLGTSVGLCMTFRYLSQVPPAEQLQTLAMGCEESLHNLVLALILVVLAGVLTAVAIMRRSSTTREPAVA